MPTLAKEDDARSETSDELRERREREEERRVDAEELHSEKKTALQRSVALDALRALERRLN
jgi:hypothetical protein